MSSVAQWITLHNDLDPKGVVASSGLSLVFEALDLFDVDLATCKYSKAINNTNTHIHTHKKNTWKTVRESKKAKWD